MIAPAPAGPVHCRVAPPANVGVESGVRTARDLGYDVVVVSDCCYNVHKDLHEWTLGKIMPIFARVLTTDEVLKLLA